MCFCRLQRVAVCTYILCMRLTTPGLWHNSHHNTIFNRTQPTRPVEHPPADVVLAWVGVSHIELTEQVAATSGGYRILITVPLSLNHVDEVRIGQHETSPLDPTNSTVQIESNLPRCLYTYQAVRRCARLLGTYTVPQTADHFTQASSSPFPLSLSSYIVFNSPPRVQGHSRLHLERLTRDSGRWCIHAG